MELNFFDPAQEYAVVERRLPHWTQAGVLAFITWRTADSLPTEVVERCVKDREILLRNYQIDIAGDWRAELDRLPPAIRAKIKWAISERWDQSLDQCHGKCLLKQARTSQIVFDNLQYLDGKEYELTDLVVMPNHIHCLAAFPTEEAMLERIAAWKRYQARAINKLIGKRGHFWQEDGFDHLVRNPDQFEFFRRYIADNPVKARLLQGEYQHYSKPL